jgi:hypothetical protein
VQIFAGPSSYPPLAVHAPSALIGAAGQIRVHRRKPAPAGSDMFPKYIARSHRSDIPVQFASRSACPPGQAESTIPVGHRAARPRLECRYALPRQMFVSRPCLFFKTSVPVHLARAATDRTSNRLGRRIVPERGYSWPLGTEDKSA